MIKKILYTLLIAGVLAFVFALLANAQIESAAKGKTFSKLEEVPVQHTGLLLGTSKFLGDGRINHYYQYRIDATVALFKAGKIKQLIISGDNSRKDYDEPSQMKADLIAAGIDGSKIYLDYAGFRTLDSMVRAKEIFGQKSVTVISQEFHNERAIYLAQRSGLTAIGYNADDVEGRNGLKTTIREYFARVKVFVDLMTGKEPHFLGEKVDMSKPALDVNPLPSSKSDS